MTDVTFPEALVRMLAVLAAIAAFIGVVFGLHRLFEPDYAKVTPRTLAAALIRETEAESSGAGSEPQPCRRQGDTWSCFVPASEGDSGARYRVTIRERYCWTAVKVVKESAGRALPKEVDDCVRAEDRPD